MVDAVIARFSSTPWCNAYITSPNWALANTASRVPKPTSEDSFFAETLGTSRTIRAVLTLRPTKELEDGNALGDMTYGEVVTMMELGDGLNGHPRIAHGGFIATMLDEVMGVLLTLNIEARVKRKRDMGVLGSDEAMNGFTAYLNTSYKKPLPTPGIVLCTAKFERREKNKIYVQGTIEDGQGTVFTIGEGMFVEVNMKNRL
ncbi:hypothetical protein P280DRAFT_487523 [Massarina eburnea CBS 473.64]|uniref:Thioesterase domain-containing protein n=1 Tax=Massarina eburnea CBS 473.64 TaxID=1395130 RepID=A0A6A6SFQ5_9PLEO|nr:hypothetical protein P280DRAFT_487523 [Massarina eburnea CBS 473.64]